MFVSNKLYYLSCSVFYCWILFLKENFGDYDRLSSFQCVNLSLIRVSISVARRRFAIILNNEKSDFFSHRKITLLIELLVTKMTLSISRYLLFMKDHLSAWTRAHRTVIVAD